MKMKMKLGLGFSSPSVTETTKWFGLVTAIWVQCISGNNYTFSNYSAALKTLMGLTQLQLNTLSVAKDVGKAFGLLAGLASDRLPAPLLLAVGSALGLLSYGIQWLVVSETLSPLPYWQMCVVLCIGGNSTTWMNTAVLVTCIRNFRRSRGPVSGLLKGYVGLSTAIFTDLCSALFADDPASFLLMLAVVPAAVCLFAAVFLRESPDRTPSPEEERAESRCFSLINAAAIAIAVYLLAYDLSGRHGTAVSRLFVSGLIVLLVVPVAVPIYLGFKTSRSKIEDVEEKLLITEVDAAAAEEEEVNAAVLEKRWPEIGEEHSIREAMAKLDFWIMFVSFLCGVGTGMAVMNNMGQMGLAMGYADVSVFISLISIWGFFGRIGSGTISEYFLKKSAIPRPLWNAASQILMAAGYVIMALALPGSLYLGSVVVGICYGVRLAVTVPTASELFGLQSYGLIYNVLILNLPLGSFLFSGLLAGFLYDAQATATAGGGNTCVGAHCYRLVFVIMAFACFVGFGFDVLLAYRTKQVYMKIHLNKNAKKAGSKPVKS